MTMPIYQRGSPIPVGHQHRVAVMDYDNESNDNNNHHHSNSDTNHQPTYISTTAPSVMAVPTSNGKPAAVTTNNSAAASSAQPVIASSRSIDDADVAAGAQERGGDMYDYYHQKVLQQQQFQQQQQIYNNNNNLLLNNMNSNYQHQYLIEAPSSLQSTVSTQLSSAPTSLNSVDTTKFASDLEIFEECISEPVLVLGIDISHLSRQVQFIVCAIGVFFFSLLYGFLQELISVQLCNRKLGLFLAMVQFSGYTVLAYGMRQFVYEKQRKQKQSGGGMNMTSTVTKVPFYLYLSLSMLRAVDLAMTNLAMQYINYPAKTLMKSSRVVFTMIFGVFITRKTYHMVDYFIVLTMVAGLAMFMHADANSSAVFHHKGVIMLTVSLICDGAITNMSENIMNKYGVGQDEFIFRMYSIALIAISAAAAYKGDLREGILWMSQPGTYDELDLPINERTWSVLGKIMCISIFSIMGFFGSSCSAAITKNFGALSMSITSTARKATTLFLSFFLFNNVCTKEHVGGIIIFISALTAKSLRRRGGKFVGGNKNNRRRKRAKMQIAPINSHASPNAPPDTGNVPHNLRGMVPIVEMVPASSLMDRGDGNVHDDHYQPLLMHRHHSHENHQELQPKVAIHIGAGNKEDDESLSSLDDGSTSKNKHVRVQLV